MAYHAIPETDRESSRKALNVYPTIYRIHIIAFILCHGLILQFSNFIAGLLAQYIEQNAELTRLQTESAALEAELDTLITQFDQTSARLSTCNKN